MLKKIKLILLLILTVFIFIIIHPFQKKACVNIYDWYGVLPQSVIDIFEKETGIHVHYDVFDNNETLEAKLLASNSGYDVVFPTVTPYAVRQLFLGIYQQINKLLLPNLGEIEPILKQKMDNIDAKMDFLLPYYWGTTGIAFDEDKIKAIIPDIPKEGYELLFNLENVKKLAPYGISFLQEPVDVFPPFLAYLGKGRENRSLEDLWEASRHLSEICSYVRRFSSSRFMTDLILGDICIAQSWSGEALKAMEDAQKIGRHIRYIIPKEGADIWIDAIAIPVGAPHVKNAHIFINFLLRPDISAMITNHSKIATMITASKQFISEDILKNPLIFPSQDVLSRLHIAPIFVGQEAETYERVRMRMWAQIKMQRDMTPSYFWEVVQKQKARARNYKTA